MSSKLSKPGTLALVCALVAGAATVAGSAQALPADSAHKEIRNVIYLLGDGMSRSHVAAARYRFHGADGMLNMERLPAAGTVSTHASRRNSDFPVLVTDSSSAATAWASGVKTYNGAVGIDAYGRQRATLMEQAKASGFATGNVTTAEVTDATPAAQYSHVLHRNCQGPDFSADACVFERADGTFEPLPDNRTLVTPIAEQIARNGTADVVFGGGLARFEPDDQLALEAQGYQLLGNFGDPAMAEQTAASQTVATRADLDKAAGSKVFGLFNRGNLTTEHARTRLPADSPAHQEPTLAEMTRASISLLSRRRDTKGFFLQIEGASIDKRSHANEAAQTLGEVKAFDDAVKAAVDFARRDGNTLVIVTADHECAGFSLIEKGAFTNAEAVAPPDNRDSDNPANNGSPTRTRSDHKKDPLRSGGIINGAGSQDPKNFAPATLRTPDDPADVVDGSPDASLWLSYLSGEHTGADVPLYAYGPGSGRLVGGQDNIELYEEMFLRLFGQTAAQDGSIQARERS
ncbi:alkaline phosphatase [Streptomyces mesophilus]|uniref:alkaline phosphatase n=1 Tax=Streptomyces mesophilus TaxID=1775132 RepID=UPI0033312D57